MDDIRSLPALAVRGVVPIPNNDIRIDVGRKKSLQAIDEAETSYDGQILIVVQKNPLIENPTPDDIEEYGVLANISMKVKLPNGNIKVKFKVIQRVKIKEYFLTNPFFVCKYEEVETIVDDVEKEKTLTKMVLNEVINNAKAVLNTPQEVLKSAQSGVTTEKMVDILVFGLKSDELKKYKYLREENLNNRLQYILEDIAQLKMADELERKINEEVRKNIDESQRILFKRKDACDSKWTWR